MTKTKSRTIAVTLPPFGSQGLMGSPSSAARGLVVFAHGSGSSRFSPRNAFIAEALQHAGFATLLFDLLNEEEAADQAMAFDIPLLADRLDQAATWAHQMAVGPDLPLGFFGAGTGAAAALVAAAARRDVAAIVSRGGRPELAGDALAKVSAATLCIVGSHDPEILAVNEAACRKMQCKHQLEVVPGATHLFEEPGALNAVVALARDWFQKHLATQQAEKKYAFHR